MYAQSGLTPLHVAAHYDNQKVALLLLNQGASPHAAAKVRASQSAPHRMFINALMHQNLSLTLFGSGWKQADLVSVAHMQLHHAL